MNFPTSLTVFRILLIPLLVIVFYLPFDWKYYASVAIFSVAAITDWFDGFLARRYSQTTRFGTFLDPVADKLLVIAALTLLIAENAAPWFTIPALIIIIREVLVCALREWMAEVGKRQTIAVSMIGKVKLFCQVSAIIVLLFARPEEQVLLFTTGVVLLYIAAFFTIWSVIHYFYAAWDTMPMNK